VAAVVLLGACGASAADEGAALVSGSGSADAAGRVKVVTTVAPITSIVAAVAGDRAEVRGLVPEGTNSHTFAPPPSAARALAEADLVVLNGLGLEEQVKELAEADLRDDARLLEVGAAVLPESDYLYDFSFPREQGRPNPHLWTDPTYAISYAGEIRQALTELDPAGADAYRRNHDAFVEQATALSDALRSDQATVTGPRELLTYHDAYAYFAKTYGWKVVGAIQPRDFEDPTPKEVARLIDQVRAEKVPVIFGSEVFPSKALEEIGRATGARYEDTLRDDDLPGRPGEAAHSWLGLMRYDYVTMIRALGGSTTHLDAVDVAPAVPDGAEYPQ
jgi:ABC-type Zn uptake system ZnuABC Zn-binding protein ZnuA